MQPLSALQISQVDITQLEVDAVVNAANAALSGGGGVDGAIHKAAGPQLAEACRKLGGCKTGDAVITGGYNLPARYVIHAVGPVWWGGDRNERTLLAQCYTRALELATQHQVQSIAFPAISCGAYRFPTGEAAQIAINTILEFLYGNRDAPSQIILVCFDPKVKKAYQNHLNQLGYGS